MLNLSNETNQTTIGTGLRAKLLRTFETLNGTCRKNENRGSSMLKREKLADYVRRKIKEKGLTYRDFENLASGITTKSTLGRVLNDGLENVSMKVIVGIAKALNEPMDEVFRVAVAPFASPSQFSNSLFHPEEDKELVVLFYKYNQMTEEDKAEMKMLLEVVDAEIERRRKKSS